MMVATNASPMVAWGIKQIGVSRHRSSSVAESSRGQEDESPVVLVNDPSMGMSTSMGVFVVPLSCISAHLEAKSAVDMIAGMEKQAPGSLRHDFWLAMDQPPAADGRRR